MELGNFQVDSTVHIIVFPSIKLFALETLLFGKPYLAIENETLNRHLISHIIVIKKQPTVLCTRRFSLLNENVILCTLIALLVCLGQCCLLCEKSNFP